MRKHTKLLAASLAAIAGLSACGQSEPEVLNGMYDPSDADDLATQEANTEVPPMVRASRSYRCKDNSVVYVTFYTEDAQVGVADTSRAPPTILTNEAIVAAAAGGTPPQPDSEIGDAPAEESPIRFSGNGYTLVGTGNSIQYGQGGNLQTCNG